MGQRHPGAEGDCMLSHSPDDVPELIGVSAAGAAFWEGRFLTSRQTPSPIVPYDQGRSCAGEARGFEVTFRHVEAKVISG